MRFLRVIWSTWSWQRAMVVSETLFLACFWWQTRINLTEWWPAWISGVPRSDYIYSFIYLSDVLFGATLVIWIIGNKLLSLRLVKEPKTWRARSWWRKPLAWYALLLAAAAVSLISQGVGEWGWFKWLKLVEGGAMMIFFSYRLRRTAVVQRYGVMLVGGLMLEAGLLIAEWLKQGSLGLQWLGEWHFTVMTPGVAKITVHGIEVLRPMATFAHPNLIAGILALAAPVGVGLWWWSRTWSGSGWRGWVRSRWQLFMVGWIVLALLGLVVTFSRSAWLIGLAFSSWVLVWRVRGRSGDWKVALRQRGQAGAVLGLSLVVFLCLMAPLAISRFTSLSSYDTASLDRRAALNQTGLQLWHSHFWWGMGLNQFVPNLSSYGPLSGVGIWRQPVHNLYLLVGVELGVIGLLGLAGWLASLIIPVAERWWRGDRKLTDQLLLGCWIGWLLLGMIDHYWWTLQQGQLATWLLAGATMARRASQSTNS